MNSKIYLLFAAAVTVFAAHPVLADEPVVAGGGSPPSSVVVLAEDGAPRALPIWSPTMVKGAAMEYTTDSFISMWCASKADSLGEKTYYNLQRNSGESPVEFGIRTCSRSFKFDILDHRDAVGVDAQTWMNWKGTYYPTFSGAASTFVTDLPGGGSGFNMPLINLQLAQTIYLPAGNLKNAYIIKRDKFGNIQYGLPLDIVNDLFAFPTKYAGPDAMVTAWGRGDDGQWFEAAYSNDNPGGRVKPIHVTGTTAGIMDNSVEGSITPAPGTVNYFFVNGIAKWGNTPPVFRLTVNPSPQGDFAADFRVVSAIFNERGNVLGYPTYATFMVVGGNLEDAKKLPIESNGTLKLRLGMGTYQIGFENEEIWTQFRPQTSPDDNPYNGAGEALGTSATLEGADAAAAETP